METIFSQEPLSYKNDLDSWDGLLNFELIKVNQNPQSGGDL